MSVDADVDSLADVVVNTMHRALAPVLADVKVLQSQIATWEARWGDLGALRERVAVVESKSQQPALSRQVMADDVLAPVLARLEALETREAIAGPQGEAGAPGPVGPEGARGEAGPAGERGLDGAAGRDGAVGAVGPRGEPGSPGERGLDGAKGVDGRDGKDGADAILPDLNLLATKAAALVPLTDLRKEAETLRTRIDAIETQQVSDSDLTAMCGDMTRTLLAELPSVAPIQRMQKRVIRDKDGKIHRIIEEPIAP